MWLSHENWFRRVTGYADIAQIMATTEVEQSEHGIREIGQSPPQPSSR